jgi:hypothetical protein
MMEKLERKSEVDERLERVRELDRRSSRWFRRGLASITLSFVGLLILAANYKLSRMRQEVRESKLSGIAVEEDDSGFHSRNIPWDEVST